MFPQNGVWAYPPTVNRPCFRTAERQSRRKAKPAMRLRLHPGISRSTGRTETNGSTREAETSGRLEDMAVAELKNDENTGIDFSLRIEVRPPIALKTKKRPTTGYPDLGWGGETPNNGFPFRSPHARKQAGRLTYDAAEAKRRDVHRALGKQGESPAWFNVRTGLLGLLRLGRGGTSTRGLRSVVDQKKAIFLVGFPILAGR